MFITYFRSGVGRLLQGAGSVCSGLWGQCGLYRQLLSSALGALKGTDVHRWTWLTAGIQEDYLGTLKLELHTVFSDCEILSFF